MNFHNQIRFEKTRKETQVRWIEFDTELMKEWMLIDVEGFFAYLKDISSTSKEIVLAKFLIYAQYVLQVINK